ncbi:HDOD domain-containing protein [Thalassotalea sp. LPB0316]|uniref:EAL and HDOD domain-containing protein n=1 Tax=Thalassotalea sp. LPB0316 TaxID=2769490 RepID=UPI0018674C61|nr:HDOD domain-containing protein [Thalassotalea sp. LPB0316]QOL26326.1 HDOD domain-containing protein [Thalassotalea sp. LPB0316]
MYSYVARQPILDSNQELVAYELLFRDGESNQFPNICPDQATSNLLTNNHLHMGVEKVTGDLPAFINFHADTLIKNFPSFLDPEKVVIEILEDVPISEELLTACRDLRAKGYKFALDDHDFDPKWDVFFPLVDIIKVDVLNTNMLSISRYVRRLQEHNLVLLAEKVETAEQFAQLKLLGFTHFQGYFFARPEMIKQKKISTAKQKILSLIEQANQVQLDFDKISEIFSSDTGLTYKLLRFINSPTYGRNQEITSLKHALIYIGEAELKKFIALLALSDLNEDQPSETLRMSLTRAKFCEQISNLRQDEENPPKAFLTGMLSMIDGILNSELDSVLEILPIHPEIKAALKGKKNNLFGYLLLARKSEKGLWQQAEKLADKLKIAKEQYYQAHAKALEWADEMMLTQQTAQ